MCLRNHHTPGDHVRMHAPTPLQESLDRDGTRISLLAKPSPNPDQLYTIPGVTSLLLMLRWVFYEYYIMKLPVEDL
jgi:hypothetical protein